MIGEKLLNISKMSNNRFKILTDKFTYIYITMDKYSASTNVKNISNIIYLGEIIRVEDDGVEFTIITDSGENKIELISFPYEYGYFTLLDKF